MHATRMLRRAAISAFVTGHVAAVVIWNVPNCPLRAATITAFQYYMMPTGQWQYWGMFAPDPMRDSLTLEAVAVDARGMMHIFLFPRMADYNLWEDIPRVRHSKYSSNYTALDSPELKLFGAKHALRQLNLPASAYPVALQLRLQLTPAPPPGGPPRDPMEPTIPFALENYRFISLEDTRS